MLSAIFFALTITMPNLLLMALGVYLKKNNAIDDNFVHVGSNVVFNYCLPCLLFFSVLKSEISFYENINLLSAGLMTTFTLFFLAEIYAKFFVQDIRDKGVFVQGVFVQGVFRSNMAIISLASVVNAYGDKAISIGALYMGVITILYNVLSVITLSRTQKDSTGFQQKSMNMFKKIAKNPLIVALVLAFVYKGIDLPMLPTFINKTGELLANTALPLALICAGASINAKTMFALTGVSMQASIGRIVVAPLLAVLAGLLFGLEPMSFGVLFMMVASPAAAASYVMAKAMGGNASLAANILAFTTVFSMIGMAVGMAILRILGWV